MAVRAIPGARKSEITGEENGRLKVRLSAPPAEGKANRELLRLLAKEMGLRKSQARLVSGERSRDKIVLLAGLPASEVKNRLQKVLRAES